MGIVIQSYFNLILSVLQVTSLADSQKMYIGQPKTPTLYSICILLQFGRFLRNTHCRGSD